MRADPGYNAPMRALRLLCVGAVLACQPPAEDDTPVTPTVGETGTSESDPSTDVPLSAHLVPEAPRAHEPEGLRCVVSRPQAVEITWLRNGDPFLGATTTETPRRHRPRPTRSPQAPGSPAPPSPPSPTSRPTG